MQFGVHIFPTEYSIQPDELARAVEERGLDSLWFSEHTHIPVRFLNTSEHGTSLPDYYWQTYDLFVAMTLAAAVTKDIKIASGVSLVIEHDTILLAKETAVLRNVEIDKRNAPAGDRDLDLFERRLGLHR